MKINFTIFIVIILFLFVHICEPLKNNNETVFWTLQLSTFDKYFKNILSNYKDVKWIDVPYSEGEKRILAAVLTDNPPDLANATPDFSMLLAKKNALFEIPKEKLENYNLAQALSYNGKYFGIPFYATSAVTLFNKSLMPQLKNMPKTFDELLKLKPPKSVYTTMLALTENDTLLKILNKYGINSYKTINSQKSREIFELIKHAYDNKYIPRESITQGHREAMEKYMAGKLVFLVTGANFLNMIKENAPEVYKNTVILPQITGSGGKYDFSLMNFIIPKKAHNIEKALEFALFLTNPENQLEFSKLTSVLPVNKISLENEFFKSINENDLTSKARLISAKQLKNAQMPLSNIKNAKNLNALAANAIQEILINNKDIKETLDKFSRKWEKLEN